MADEAQEAHSDDGSPIREDAHHQHQADQGSGPAGDGPHIDAIDDAEAYMQAAGMAGNMPPDTDDADDDGASADVDELPIEDEHDFPELAQPEEGEEDEEDEVAEVAEIEDDADDGSDDGETNKDGTKPPQFRFRPKNELEEKAFWYMRRNADLSLEDAVARAKAELDPGDQDDGDGERGEDSTPQTREELESLIQEARADKRDALGEFDYEKVAEIESRLDNLIDLREPLRERDTAHQAEAQDTFRRDLAETNQAYPDAAKPDSEFYQRMSEYDAHLKATDHPLFYDPGKASIIAKQVAAELGVVPVLPRKAATGPKPASQPPSRRQAAPRPASGSARTNGGTTSIEASIDAVRDPESYMEFVGAGY